MKKKNKKNNNLTFKFSIKALSDFASGTLIVMIAFLVLTLVAFWGMPWALHYTMPYVDKMVNWMSNHLPMPPEVKNRNYQVDDEK
jgi:hypothetical protein